MEIAYDLILIFCAFSLLSLAWRAFYLVWLRPRRLERCLRRQGLMGNSYRLLHGDAEKVSIMLKEANSRPINLSDDIVPRVIPFLYKTIQQYGMQFKFKSSTNDICCKLRDRSCVLYLYIYIYIYMKWIWIHMPIFFFCDCRLGFSFWILPFPLKRVQFSCIIFVYYYYFHL